MKKRTLADKLKETKQLLEANDKQMAYHLKLTFKTYERLINGEITLNMRDRTTIEKRMEGLLERCGISTEHVKQR